MTVKEKGLLAMTVKEKGLLAMTVKEKEAPRNDGRKKGSSQ